MKEDAKSRKAELMEHLKVSILTLRLRPGADLDEALLSDSFGLSRTPLREVFRQLAGEGYLDLRTNRSARVSEMSYTTLRDFFLAAPMIYGAVLRLGGVECDARADRRIEGRAAGFQSGIAKRGQEKIVLWPITAFTM